MNVQPGGFFYSNFDPVRPSSRFLATCFYNVDTILAQDCARSERLAPRHPSAAFESFVSPRPPPTTERLRVRVILLNTMRAPALTTA